jgi:hypothetical protein
MSWLICGSTSVVPKEPKTRKIVFVPSDSTNLSDLFTKEADLSTNYVDELLESRFTTLELRVEKLESYFKPLQTLETLEHLEVPVVERPVTPVVERPVTPVVERPVTPVVERPVTPVVDPVAEPTEEKPVLVIEEIKVEELTTVTAFPEPKLELPSVVLPELVLDTKEVLANFFKTIHEEIYYIEKNMNAPLPVALIEQLKRLSHDAKLSLPRTPRLEPPRLR